MAKKPKFIDQLFKARTIEDFTKLMTYGHKFIEMTSEAQEFTGEAEGWDFFVKKHLPLQQINKMNPNKILRIIIMCESFLKKTQEERENLQKFLSPQFDLLEKINQRQDEKAESEGNQKQFLENFIVLDQQDLAKLKETYKEENEDYDKKKKLEAFFTILSTFLTKQYYFNINHIHPETNNNETETDYMNFQSGWNESMEIFVKKFDEDETTFHQIFKHVENIYDAAERISTPNALINPLSKKLMNLATTCKETSTDFLNEYFGLKENSNPTDHSGKSHGLSDGSNSETMNTLSSAALKLQAHSKTSSRNRKWAKIILASVCGLLGTALIAASIALAVTTFGVSTPLSAAGIALGANVIVAGVTIGLAAAAGVGLATTSTFFAKKAIEDKKETNENIEKINKNVLELQDISLNKNSQGK